MSHVEPQPVFAPPPYHMALRAHLEASEPELWAWFAETIQPSKEEIDEAELELLKNAYRLDGDVFDVLTANATLMAGKLGLHHDISLYQELNDTGRNARVQILGHRVHVVFGGDLLSLLDPGEQRAVLAHELAHVSLLDQDHSAYRVLDTLVHRIAEDFSAHDAVVETVRRLRLHTEVYADALAAQITGERDDLIAAVVKLQSGLHHVDPAAYLRQAEELLLSGNTAAATWTHPELHIRVACLAANVAAGPDGANPELLRDLIEGPDDLDRMDLLAQLRVQALVEQVLQTGRTVLGATEAVESHVRSFTDMKSVSATLPPPLGEDQLAQAPPSIRFLAASLLVDFALLEVGMSRRSKSSDFASLSELGAVAERVGVATEFDRIMAKATERSLADIRTLRRKSE